MIVRMAFVVRVVLALILVYYHTTVHVTVAILVAVSTMDVKILTTVYQIHVAME